MSQNKRITEMGPYWKLKFALFLADSGNERKRNGNLDHFLADNGNGPPPLRPPHSGMCSQ